MYEWAGLCDVCAPHKALYTFDMWIDFGKDRYDGKEAAGQVSWRIIEDMTGPLQ